MGSRKLVFYFVCLCFKMNFLLDVFKLRKIQKDPKEKRLIQSTWEGKVRER